MMPGVRIGNRRSIKLSEVPVFPVSDLASEFSTAIIDHWRIVSLFGAPESDDRLRLISILAHDQSGQLAVSSADHRTNTIRLWVLIVGRPRILSAK